MSDVIDVLAVFDRLIGTQPLGLGPLKNCIEARAAVAELILAATEVCEHTQNTRMNCRLHVALAGVGHPRQRGINCG